MEECSTPQLVKVDVFLGSRFIREIEVRDFELNTVLKHPIPAGYLQEKLPFNYLGKTIVFYEDKE